MQKAILELYTTFFGKFKFFHKFVSVLLAMDEKMSDIEIKILNIKKEVEALRDEYKSIEEKVNSMPKSEPSESSNFSSASDILDRKFRAYNKED